jgi:hypothetical protein
MAYAIRDVDRALYDLIHKKNFSVIDEGMDVRMRVLHSTPEEALSKKTYPCIYINSGYNIKTPEFWQRNKISYEINSVDDRLIDKKSAKLITFFYGYRIGFYVTKRSHCNYLVTELLYILDNNFDLKVVNSLDEIDYVWFRREGSFITLDEFDEDVKIFRRDIVLVSQLLLEKQEVETLLRPYQGLEITIFNKEE